MNQLRIKLKWISPQALNRNSGQKIKAASGVVDTGMTSEPSMDVAARSAAAEIQPGPQRSERARGAAPPPASASGANGAVADTIRNIAWASAGTPFGRGLLAVSAQGIVGLSFPGDDGQAARRVVTQLEKRWPKAVIEENADVVAPWWGRIFPKSPVKGSMTIPVIVRGTSFQYTVWKVLLSIPPGFTRNYQEVACLSGRPQATRAAANAVAVNTVAWLIPCHRVVRKDGGLGGYAWGTACKQAMLDYERELRHHQHAG